MLIKKHLHQLENTCTALRKHSPTWWDMRISYGNVSARCSALAPVCQRTLYYAKRIHWGKKHEFYSKCHTKYSKRLKKYGSCKFIFFLFSTNFIKKEKSHNNSVWVTFENVSAQLMKEITYLIPEYDTAVTIKVFCAVHLKKPLFLLSTLGKHPLQLLYSLVSDDEGHM